MAVKRYREAGAVGLRRAWKSPPQQSIELIPRGVRRAAWGCGTPEPPAGYELEGTTRMGALALYGLMTRVVGGWTAWEAAEGWEGDRLSLYGNPDEQTVVVWQIELEPLLSAALVGSVREYYGPRSRIAYASGQLHIALSTQADLSNWDAWQRCNPSAQAAAAQGPLDEPQTLLAQEPPQQSMATPRLAPLSR